MNDQHDGENDEQVDRPDHYLEVGVCYKKRFVEAKIVVPMVRRLVLLLPLEVKVLILDPVVLYQVPSCRL